MTETMMGSLKAAVERELDADFEAWSARWLTPAGLCEDAPEPPGKYKTSPERIVRAVLQALMEPTEEMLDAGWDAFYSIESYPGDGPLEHGQHKAIWQAMLSSILTEKGGAVES